MNILVVCQYYYPENFQITPICERLVQNGYTVTVLTGLPNYPTGIIPNEYKHGQKRNEIINGVHVIRCFEVGRKHGPIFLALNYFSFILSATKKIKQLKENFDVIYVYQLSPVFMGIPAVKYAKKYNVPLFLYCCDLWPESLKMYIKNESNPLFKYAKIISRSIYKNCNLIAVQSISFSEYFSEVHGIEKEKLIYIPAFADESYLTQDFTPSDDYVDFVFLGNLGKAQNLLALLKAVDSIKDVQNFKVHFVGDGSYLEEMKAFVREKQLDDCVFFYGRRPVYEMPDFYKLADVCLVSLKADNKTGLTLPSKVQGYMAAGKPILAMITGSAKDVIEEAKCGICVEPDDIATFANAMKDFINNKNKYSDAGKNGREYFMKNFRKDIFMRKLENALSSLIN